MPENIANGRGTHLAPGEGAAFWVIGILVTYKAVSKDTGGAYSVFELTVPPQSGAPPHIHHFEDESFYILEGDFELLNNDRTIKAPTGAFAHIPKGTLHNYTNVGTSTGRLLIITTPGGRHEGMFAEMGEPATDRSSPPAAEGPPDIERLTAVAWKWDTEIPPPE